MTDALHIFRTQGWYNLPKLVEAFKNLKPWQPRAIKRVIECKSFIGFRIYFTKKPIKFYF